MFCALLETYFGNGFLGKHGFVMNTTNVHYQSWWEIDFQVSRWMRPFWPFLAPHFHLPTSPEPSSAMHFLVPPGIHSIPWSWKVKTFSILQFMHCLDYHLFSNFNFLHFSNKHTGSSINASIEKFQNTKILNTQQLVAAILLKWKCTVITISFQRLFGQIWYYFIT